MGSRGGAGGAGGGGIVTPGGLTRADQNFIGAQRNDVEAQVFSLRARMLDTGGTIITKGERRRSVRIVTRAQENLERRGLMTTTLRNQLNTARNEANTRPTRAGVASALGTASGAINARGLQ